MNPNRHTPLRHPSTRSSSTLSKRRLERAASANDPRRIAERRQRRPAIATLDHSYLGP